MFICSLESGEIGVIVFNYVVEKELDFVLENVLFYLGKS